MGIEPKTALQVVRDAWERAYNVQSARNDIYLRLWQRYKGYNPNVSDIYRPNLVIPKLYTAIETLVPRLAKALFGKRPYIPIRSEKNPQMVEPIELALDAYLYKQRFNVIGGQMLKAVALFGTCFIEPLPKQELVVEKQMVPSQTYPFQPMPVEVKIPRFRLETRMYMPWQVYVEPQMLNTDSPGYLIVIEIVPKSEILRLIDAGRYPTADREKISTGVDDQNLKWSENMMKALNIERPADDDSYGVTMRYMDSDSRYITNWNGMDTLEDVGNPFNHGKINPVRCVWNYDPMLQNSFWGQPEAKAIEGILDKLDESYNDLFHEADLVNHAVMAYNEKAIRNPDNLINAGGAKIRIASEFSGALKDAVQILETRGLPSDFYNIPGILDQETDRAMGIHAIQRGEGSSDRQTATESSLLYTQGDLRSEQRARILEALALGDFADKATSHIDQFASFDDLFAEIGEKALMAATMNPAMIPGGFNYQFKGSDSILHDGLRQAAMKETVQLLVNNPAIRPDGLARYVCEREGLSEAEVNQIVFSPEEMQQMAMAQQAAEDRERALDLEADVIRAREGATAKAKAQAKNPPKKTGTVKKRKAAQTPTAASPSGSGRKK